MTCSLFQTNTPNLNFFSISLNVYFITLFGSVEWTEILRLNPTNLSSWSRMNYLWWHLNSKNAYNEGNVILNRSKIISFETFGFLKCLIRLHTICNRTIKQWVPLCFSFKFLSDGHCLCLNNSRQFSQINAV